MNAAMSQLIDDDAAMVEPTTPSASLGEDMAFAVGTAAMFLACNAALPVTGNFVAAALVPAVNRLREKVNGRGYQRSSTAPTYIEREVDWVCSVRKLGPTPAEQAWCKWLPWTELHQGRKVEVPPDLPHPREAGFSYTKWGRGVGQVADWVRSMPDGSRLHAHEFADGSIMVHRDNLDPATGATVASFHWLSETPEGKLLGAALTVGTIFTIWKLVEPQKAP